MPVQARSAEAPEAARTAADLYPAMSQDILWLARRLPSLAGSLLVHAILILGMGLVVGGPRGRPPVERAEAAWTFPGFGPDQMRGDAPRPWGPERPASVQEFFDREVLPPPTWEEEFPEHDLALASLEPALLRPDLLVLVPEFADEAGGAEPGLPPWWSLFVPLGR